jgi:hypothetical protein
MKKRFMVEIEVDEKNISKKYPNYSINWSKPEEFINHLMKDFVSDSNMKKWGYSKKILRRRTL